MHFKPNEKSPLIKLPRTQKRHTPLPHTHTHPQNKATQKSNKKQKPNNNSKNPSQSHRSKGNRDKSSSENFTFSPRMTTRGKKSDLVRIYPLRSKITLQKQMTRLAVHVSQTPTKYKPKFFQKNSKESLAYCGSQLFPQERKTHSKESPVG